MLSSKRRLTANKKRRGVFCFSYVLFVLLTLVGCDQNFSGTYISENKKIPQLAGSIYTFENYGALTVKRKDGTTYSYYFNRRDNTITVMDGFGRGRDMLLKIEQDGSLNATNGYVYLRKVND